MQNLKFSLYRPSKIGRRIFLSNFEDLFNKLKTSESIVFADPSHVSTLLFHDYKLKKLRYLKTKKKFEPCSLTLINC